jgi:hypothetical protein
MPRKSREEARWEQLVEEAGDELVEAASRVSVAQAEKDLAEAGFDVAEERARAEAFLASLEGAVGEVAAPTKPEPVQAVAQIAPARARRADDAGRKKRVPAVVWAVAAAVAAGGAAAIYAETRPDKVTPPGPTPTPSPSPVPSLSAPPTAPDLLAAVDLRHRASAALDTGFPDECLALLDQAREKDPAGDATPDVTKLRGRARRAIESKPK